MILKWNEHTITEVVQHSRILNDLWKYYSKGRRRAIVYAELKHRLRGIAGVLLGHLARRQRQTFHIDQDRGVIQPKKMIHKLLGFKPIHNWEAIEGKWFKVFGTGMLYRCEPLEKRVEYFHPKYKAWGVASINLALFGKPYKEVGQPPDEITFAGRIDYNDFDHAQVPFFFQRD